MVRNFAVAILALGVALPAHAATEPTLGIVQAAYDREQGRSDIKHDKDLVITSVQCSSGKSEREYLCWVNFISRADPTETVYFDVAAVAEIETGWTLKSGLCRR